MSEHPFHKFLDLINCDHQIHSMRQKLAEHAQKIERLNRQQQEYDDQLAVSKKNVAVLRKSVEELELNAKEVDARQKDKKSQLEDSSKYKEYQSLQKEFERLQAAQNENERAVLQAWKALEVAEQQLVKNQSECGVHLIKIHAALDENRQAMASIEKELVLSIAQRELKEKQVLPDWLEKYEVMRTRVTDPVVPLVSTSCSVCFQDMTNQEMVRLKRGALLTCQGCYRLLYIEDAIIHADFSAQEE